MKIGSFLERPAVPAPPGGETAAYRPLTEGPGTVIGPYKLLQHIGEGGFGAVYMAEQEQPVRRKVALKIIKLGMDTREVIARFESERQALAMMEHPNIARVFDAGATESGRPYFVMELVRGVPITEFCDKNRFSAEQRLKLFVTVCNAIQHAHHKGIIHRDVKPSNVMVTLHDGVPVVKVIDFGVAKATAQKLTERTLFTAYGQMIGTPAYMSPEQAEMSGLDIDMRSDIFSLGVLLYELLTGTTPLDSVQLRKAGYAEMQRLIREEEAPRPSTRFSSMGGEATVLATSRGTDAKRLSQLLRSDLDWIVMKSLEKDRNRRYGSPATFAADIERYLTEQPVEGRPPSAWYRFRKMARRNKAALTTAGIVAAAMTLGTGLSLWQAVRATRAERDAVVRRDDATEQRNEAAQKRREAEVAREQLRRTLYAAHLNMAQAAWEGGRIGEVIELLGREKAASPDLCGFEWHYLSRQCNTERATVKLPGMTSVIAAFSADGSRLTALQMGRSESEKRYTAACTIWEADRGRKVASFPLPPDWGSCGPTLSADGALLAIGLSLGSLDAKGQRGELVVVDATTGRRLTTVSDLPGGTGPVAFSSDGKQVAAVVLAGDRADPVPRGGELIIWETATGRKLRAIPGVTGYVPRPAFSPDGAHIAVTSQKARNEFESEVKVWDVATGLLVRALPAAIGGALSVTSVAFSPDGKALAAVGSASSTGCELHVWDIPSGRRRFTVPGPFRDQFAQLAFSPDNIRITCAGGDPRIGLWDAATGQELAVYRGHTSNVSAVAFSRDGRHLLAADASESLKVWDAHARADALVLKLGDTPLCSAVSPDLRRIATMAGSPLGEVKVWDLTGQQLLSVKRPTARENEGGIHRTVIFSPKGDRLACGTISPDGAKLWGGLTVWDAAGRELLNLDEEGVGFSALAFSPDGTRIATSLYLGAPGSPPTTSMVRLWEIATGRQLLTIQAESAAALTFSPDGARLAAVCVGSSGQPSRILVWDTSTGSECARWQGPTGYAGSLAFSPDGRRVAATVRDLFHRGELVVGDLVSGEMRKLGRALGSVVFSPDGTRLASFSATASQPAEVGLWDADTGRQLLVLKGHTGVSDHDGIAFSPSGDRIVSTAGLRGANSVEIKTWDATPPPGARQP